MGRLQRRFDDQSQLRVMIEADAVLAIIAMCETRRLDLVSSVALDFENGKNPYPDRKARIQELLAQSDRYVERSPEVEGLAVTFVEAGLNHAARYTSPAQWLPSQIISAHVTIG